jgi:glucose-6-phosphate isomerase
MISFQHTPSKQKPFDTATLKMYYSNLTDHNSTLLDREQGFVDIYNQNTDQIKQFVAKRKDHYDVICVLGIGGSMLGPQFLYDTLGKYNKHGKSFVFVDNIDPEQIYHVRRSLPLHRTLFLVQSKSGKTPEAIALYSYFLQEVMKQGLTTEEHFVFVTDPVEGFLREESNNKAIPAFEIPQNIGGRFSVLTPIGLVMAAFADIDIDQLLAGCRAISESQIESLNEATCYTYASMLDYYYQQGISLNVLMPYSSRLRLFSNWAVQLISESTGKSVDRDNNQVNWGITPIAALGATDQHSQLQLFAEGPRNKLVTFIEVANNNDIAIEQTPLVTDMKDFSFLKHTTFGTLLSAEFRGTRQSLEEQGIPTATITLDSVNEYSIGMLIQFFQLTIGYLGEITNINMFNQPGVERSKILAKENLS